MSLYLYTYTQTHKTREVAELLTKHGLGELRVLFVDGMCFGLNYYYNLTYNITVHDIGIRYI